MDEIHWLGEHDDVEDASLAKNILAAVSQPPNNPLELFNLVMSALGH